MREPIVPQLELEAFLRWEARQHTKFELVQILSARPFLRTPIVRFRGAAGGYAAALAAVSHTRDSTTQSRPLFLAS